MPFPNRRAVQQAAADADRETLARVRGTLQGYVAVHGREVRVSALHILDLLNPRGMWSLDPEYGRPEEKKEDRPQEASPTADPLTGCEPVTAPDPGS